MLNKTKIITGILTVVIVGGGLCQYINNSTPISDQQSSSSVAIAGTNSNTISSNSNFIDGFHSYLSDK